MSNDGATHVCPEYLPFGTWTEATAKRASAEATLIEQMSVAGGGAPWRLVLGEWERLLWESLQKVSSRTVGGDAGIEGLRERQSLIAGYRLAECVVKERLHLGLDARAYLARTHVPPMAPGSGRAPKNAEQAVLWRKRAEHAQMLVETPGWGVIVRRLADRAWAACWLKSVCPPETAAALDALVKGILAPIVKLQECIALGACAEAWFQKQEQKAAKEGA